MKYDYDSYMFYEYSKIFAFTVRIRVRLKDRIDGEILEDAAKKAFKRFPYFNKKVMIDEEGGYVLLDNDKPIVVTKESPKPVVLGGNDANDQFFLITYEDRDIFFNFSHCFCGGFGAMFWIKTTLWQYLSDKTGDTFSAEGLKLPGSPLEEGEMALPDVNAFPEDAPITEYKGGNSFVPIGEYLAYYLNPFSGDATYFPIEIDLKKLMSYARIDWGNMADYIESIYNITDGHLMLEMNAIQDKLFLNFQQVNKKREYLDAFVEELKAEGIEVKVGPMQYKKLPRLKL